MRSIEEYKAEPYKEPAAPKLVKLRDIARALGMGEVGCGDNSCVWGPPGGMATNGGCRCYGRRGGESDRIGLLQMQRVARHLLDVYNVKAGS